MAMLSVLEATGDEDVDEWIWDTGAALDVANAGVEGEKEISFAPPILTAGGFAKSAETVVVPMPEIKDTVMTAFHKTRRTR